MPATVSHVLSATTPDDPAYEIKPSNWNSAHAITLNVAATEISALFSNKNGVSFGLDGTNITASVNAGGAAGSIAAGGATFALGQLEFSNASGVSFGINGSTLTASVRTNYASSDHSHGNPTLALTNLTGTTASNSAGFTLSLSALAALTSQSNQNVTAANGGFAFQTLSFSNANQVSFGTSAGSAITASIPTFSNSNNVSFGTNGGTVTASASFAQSNQVISFSASSNTTLTSDGTFNASAMKIRGIGIASVGFSAGEILISVPSGGGAGDGGVFAGVSTGGNTAGSTGTVSTGNFVLVGSNNITLSQSTGAAGSAATVSIIGPASSSLVATSGLTISTNGSTISIGEIQASFFRQAGQITAAGTAQANSLVSIQPFQLARDVVFSNALIAASVAVTTSANNSSGYLDVSMSGVIYSRNVSTLSYVTSFSNTLTQTFSSNATGTVTGVQGLTASLAAAATLTEGEYWVAFHVSTNNTATGGANTTALANTLSMILSGSIGSAANLVKVWGAQTNASMGLLGGLGILSTGATRSSIGLSDIVVTGTRAHLAPIFFELRNGTFQI